MKKLLFVGALLCVLCSSSLGNPKMNAAPANVHEGHEWVDLGLPSGLKWATCNVGASCPEEYGDYFAWGETSAKSEYTESNSASIGKSWSDIGGDSSRDAATANWGGSWRMPTKTEFEELIGNCTWTWTTQNGKNGCKVAGPNGNSIFLPAAGCRGGVRLYFDGELGYYWSSTPDEGNSGVAYNLYFDEGDRFVNWGGRDNGLSVRPVLEGFNSDAAGKIDELLNSSATGTYKGHEWVDLGLSVKWATCNVGASTPGDYGNYYAWGETATKSIYDYDNCASIGKFWGDIGGNSSRDAARANWGGSWRMPTEAELQELKDNCTWTWTTQNGHKGYKVTSKKNSQSIFLPAAGYRRGGKLYDDGVSGDYWGSTPSEGAAGACGLCFDEGYRLVDWYRRNIGHSVRPVLEGFNSDAAGKIDELLNSSATGTYKGHEWVDLGLSVKWATCNVGASTPVDYGNYYAWGETRTKSEYWGDNCSSYGKSWGDIGGNSSRDAARANWGGSWRMPTEAEYQELVDNCTWIWTTQDGHKGYKVTSKKNSQSIFLPAAGIRGGDWLRFDGECGYYWCSTPVEGNSDDAYGLYFDEGGRDVICGYRNYGISVRPVLED